MVTSYVVKFLKNIKRRLNRFKNLKPKALKYKNIKYKTIFNKIKTLVFLTSSFKKLNFNYTNFFKKLNIKYFFSLKQFFLRKTKCFNKGRYSRNRQNYRTGFYWCLYVNIIALVGLNFFFYKFIIKFTMLWYLFFFFLFIFFFSKFFKYNFYNIYNFFNEIKFLTIFSSKLINFSNDLFL